MQVGVSLALSVIPEGLVAIVTLTMGAFGCALCVVVYLCFSFVCCVVMHCAGRLATINIHYSTHNYTPSLSTHTALGMKRMAKGNALVRQLPAVEVRIPFVRICCRQPQRSTHEPTLKTKTKNNQNQTLGSVTTVCSDKTGACLGFCQCLVDGMNPYID